MIQNTQSAKISSKQDRRNIYAITKTMYPYLWPLRLRSLLSFLSTFGSLVSAIYNRTSCVQVHQLPQSYSGDNQEDTLFSWFHIYYAILPFARFEHSLYIYWLNEMEWGTKNELFSQLILTVAVLKEYEEFVVYKYWRIIHVILRLTSVF